MSCNFFSSVILLLLGIPTCQSCPAQGPGRCSDQILSPEERLQNVDHFWEPCFDRVPCFRRSQGWEEWFQSFLEYSDTARSLSSGRRINFRSFSHLRCFRICFDEESDVKLKKCVFIILKCFFLNTSPVF